MTQFNVTRPVIGAVRMAPMDRMMPPSRMDGIDLERYPKVYPFVPGSGIITSTQVRKRSNLTMSDIPQMQDEFARISRDDLLVISFLDRLAETADDGRRYEYSELSLKQRRMLADEIKTAGLDIADERNIRWVLSRILKFHGYRYPKNGCPSDLILPLIACMKAGLVDAELNRDAARMVFLLVEDEEAAIERVSRKLGIYTSDESIAMARGERSFSELSAKQVDKLGRAMYAIQQIFYGTRPIFSRDDEMMPPLCILKEGIDIEFPEEFLDSPAAFIEAQEDVQTGEDFERARQFYYVNNCPYDFGRVKRFMLGDVLIISKRIESLRVKSIGEEIAVATHINRELREKGITDARTIEYLGLVYDRGNFYLLTRDEQAPSLWDERNIQGMRKLQEVQDALSNGEHRDLEPRNALWNGRELVLLDFEAHATAVNRDNLPEGKAVLDYAQLSVVRSKTALARLDVRGDIANTLFFSRFRSMLALPSRMSRRNARLPTTVAIGDVHGAERRLAHILENPAVKTADNVVFMGDYYDRGDGKGVHKLIQARTNKRHTFLWGNHELYMLLGMMGHRKSFNSWMAYGGLEFVDGILDLSQFKESYTQTFKELPDALPDEVLDKLERNQPAVVDELFTTVTSNPLLWGIYQWQVRNGRLFHIDDYGMLYIHAGMRFAQDMNVRYLDLLGMEDEMFRKHVREGKPSNVDSARRSAAEFRHHLEDRELDWIKGFVGKNPSGIFEKLAQLGIRGVVYGHTQRGHVGNSYDRFFNIDLSMATYYGGLGGFLEIGSRGIVSHRFVDRESDEFQLDEIVGPEEFRDQVAYDARIIAQGFRDYFLYASRRFF